MIRTLRNLRKSCSASSISVSCQTSQFHYSQDISLTGSTVRKHLNYDVVIIGNDTGALMASRMTQKSSLDKKDHSVFLAHQVGTSQNSRLSAEWMNENSICHSGAAEVKHIDASARTIKLSDNTLLHYKELILASEFQQDLQSIKGLENALKDLNRPVFTSELSIHERKNSLTWKVPENGQCFFYVPKASRREVSEYTFLQVFDRLAKQSKTISFTIIVEGSSLFDSNSLKDVESQILSEIASRGIKIIWNSAITEINDSANSFTLSTQADSQITFDQLYTIVPKTAPQFIESSDGFITEGDRLLKVDQHTLAHSKHKHVFCLGSGIDISTPHSNASTFAQMQVIEKNALRSLEGQEANAFYNGYTKFSMLLASNRLGFTSTNYQQQYQKKTWSFYRSTIAQRIRYLLHTYLSPLFQQVILKANVFSRLYFRSTSWRSMVSPNKIGRKTVSFADLTQAQPKVNYHVIGQTVEAQQNIPKLSEKQYFVISGSEAISQQEVQSLQQSVEPTIILDEQQQQSVQVQIQVNDGQMNVNSVETNNQSDKKEKKQSQRKSKQLQKQMEKMWLQMQEEQNLVQQIQQQDELRLAAVQQYIQKEQAKVATAAPKKRKASASASKKKQQQQKEETQEPSLQLESVSTQPKESIQEPTGQQ